MKLSRDRIRSIARRWFQPPQTNTTKPICPLILEAPYTYTLMLVSHFRTPATTLVAVHYFKISPLSCLEKESVPFQGAEKRCDRNFRRGFI